MSNTAVVKDRLEEYVNNCIEKSKSNTEDFDEDIIKATGAVEFAKNFLANIDAESIEKHLQEYIEKTF